MHSWGDGFPYFDDVGRAASEIGQFCRLWGRIGVSTTKEKYGTARVYCTLGIYNVHSLTHPGWYNYGCWPEWLASFDRKYGHYLIKWTGLGWLFSKWQPIVYSHAYKRALNKYSHIQAEILSDADWPELIYGHTRREGNKLHILDLAGNVVSTWTTYK